LSRNTTRKTAGLSKKKPTPADPVAETASNIGLNFSTPTEHVELPSGGKFYPETHPLHGKETLEIKFMTAKEEDILTSKNLLRKGLAIERLLESIVLNKEINPSSLLVGDRNAILVASRITGFGPEYNTQITCPACNTTSETIFDLSEVTTKESEIPPEVTLTDTGTFIFELPVTGVHVETRLMTGTDEKRLLSTKETKKKHKLAETPLTDQLKLIIKSINGHEDRTTVHQFIEHMPSRDTRHLRSMYEKLTPNIDMTLEFECSNCSHETDVEVPFTTSFFWPK